MAEAATRRWTLDEFLAFDDGTDTRYELHDGALVAMAPASDRHSRIAGRVTVALGRHLEPPCEVAVGAGIVPEGGTSWYKADVAVSCTSGDPFDPYLAEPVVVVEVLSPSTAMLDRGRKLRDYQEIASVRDILLISAFERRVEHWCRQEGVWVARVHGGSGTLALEAFAISLDLAALYDGVLPAAETA